MEGEDPTLTPHPSWIDRYYDLYLLNILINYTYSSSGQQLLITADLCWIGNGVIMLSCYTNNMVIKDTHRITNSVYTLYVNDHTRAIHTAI